MVLYVSEATTNQKPTIAILGCGLMGSGIAQICVQSGYRVKLYGRNEKKLVETCTQIRKGLLKVAAKKRADIATDAAALDQVVAVQMSSLQTFTDIESSVEDASMAIEAIAENLQMKLELFTEVQKFCPRNCLLITNTSSLRLNEILPCIEDSSLFAGLHFFNPVPVMKLVEIVSTDETSDVTRDKLFSFIKDLGKLPVAAKDTPGFIVNRLLIPYLIDSIRMVERGDATKEDIDTAMRCGTAYPMGPIELCDYVGLDTLQSVMQIWCETIPGDSRFAPCALLDKLVAEGKLGRKTKQGFYSY